ncbi:hypothetical protein [Serratia aquatilis]|uniref:Uncharacterized protein n=1 Tax=Serratia aquatilis TaxID=1737515 RepID=A0ABV6EFB3_9GAMM
MPRRANCFCMLPVIGKGEIDKHPITQAHQMLAFPSWLAREEILSSRSDYGYQP